MQRTLIISILTFLPALLHAQIEWGHRPEVPAITEAATRGIAEVRFYTAFYFAGEEWDSLSSESLTSTYRFDTAGRLVSVLMGNASAFFFYDSLGRLSGYESNGWQRGFDTSKFVIRFEHDEAGNLIGETSLLNSENERSGGPGDSSENLTTGDSLRIQERVYRYHYSSKGVMLERIEVTPDCAERTIERYEYGDRGLLDRVLVLTIYELDTMYAKDIQYSRDRAGQIVSSSRYSNSGRAENYWKTEYVRNRSGLVMEILRREDNIGLSSRDRLEYNYFP